MKVEEKEVVIQQLVNDVERLKKVIHRLQKMICFFSTEEVEKKEFLQGLSPFLKDCSLQLEHDVSLINELEKNIPNLK